MTWSLFTLVQVEAQVTPALTARTQEKSKPWQTNIAATIQVKAAPGPPPKNLLAVDTVAQVRHDVKQNWMCIAGDEDMSCCKHRWQLQQALHRRPLPKVHEAQLSDLVEG